MEKEDSVVVSTRVPVTLFGELAEQAARESISMSDVVRRAIILYLRQPGAFMTPNKEASQEQKPCQSVTPI